MAVTNGTITLSGKVSVTLLAGVFAAFLSAAGWAWNTDNQVDSINEKIDSIVTTAKETTGDIKAILIKVSEQANSNARDVAILRTVLDSQNARISNLERDLDRLRKD